MHSAKIHAILSPRRINVEITKNPGENALGVLRRFSRKVQSSGVIPRKRSLRYAARVQSHYKVKMRTLKGITKPVTITFESTGSAKDPFGNTRVGFEGKATINRKDWGIEYNAALETGGVLISEKIVLELDVSAVKA